LVRGWKLCFVAVLHALRIIDFGVWVQLSRIYVVGVGYHPSRIRVINQAHVANGVNAFRLRPSETRQHGICLAKCMAWKLSVGEVLLQTRI
jgi:hypothetical protein